MNLDNDALGKLAYAAMLGETTWHHFLEQLGRTIPNGKAAFVVHDASNGEGFALPGGQTEGIAEQYNSHYGRLNPLQPILSSWPVGIATYDEELMPRNELAKTEFHGEFLVPHGLTHTAAVKLADSGSQSFSLVVSYDGRCTSSIKSSIASLNALAPHLNRAFGFQLRLAKGRPAGESNVLQALLDARDVGVIVSNGERRPTTMSKTAHTMLGANQAVGISAGGLVRFREDKIQSAYEQMLRRRYAGPKTLEFCCSQAKLTLVHLDKGREALYFEGATVIIFLEKADDASMRADLRSFAKRYRLSRGEMRALFGIVEGRTVDQIAAEAALSRETIRSQTKSLYAKAGTTGAADILRLVHQGRQPD